MKRSIQYATGLLFALAAPLATAGTAEVTWKEDGTNYTDMRTTMGAQKQFEERVKLELTAHFNKLAGEMPEDYKWQIEVTDVDLAGRVQTTTGRGSGDFVRVINDVDFPRIAFNYAVLDGSGEVVSTGSENLKDLSFTSGIMTRRERNERLYYERAMLDEWFADNKEQVIAKNGF